MTAVRLISLFVTLAGLMILPLAHAEQPTTSRKPEEVSTKSKYTTIGAFQKLLLSSTYYTNPETAQGYQFAYCFNPKDFQGKDIQLWTLGTQRAISFGVMHKEDNVIEGVELDNLEMNYSIQSSTQLKTYLSTSTCVISGDPELLGEKATTTLFKLIDRTSAKK